MQRIERYRYTEKEIQKYRVIKRNTGPLHGLLGAVLHLLLLLADPLYHALHDPLGLVLVHLALLLLGHLLLRLQMLLEADLLQLHGGVLAEHHVVRLNNNVDQLLAQARQLVLALDGEDKGLRVLGELHAFHLQEIKEIKEIEEEIKEIKEIKERNKIEEIKDIREIKEINEIKEIKEIKEIRKIREIQEIQEIQENQDIQEIKDNKENKENKKIKEIKEIQRRFGMCSMPSTLRKFTFGRKVCRRSRM